MQKYILRVTQSGLRVGKYNNSFTSSFKATFQSLQTMSKRLIYDIKGQSGVK